MSGPIMRVHGGTPEAVDPMDRGLHYGDGVFRTLRMAGGLPIAWPFHVARLVHDCERIGLSAPEPDVLAADVASLFADGGDGILKILVTRGVGGRGYTPPSTAEACCRLYRFGPAAHPPEHADSGIILGHSSVALGCQPALAGIKHCNRLEQVLARRECADQGWPEALMGTADGRLVCGTMSNLFAVIDDVVVTPAIVDAGVIGATRQRLIGACRHDDRPVMEIDVHAAMLERASEVFVCNSAMEIWPVRQWAQQHYPVGPFTRWCQAQLAAACAGF
ncbi:MAG: aminodeoxychorismate lyase [Salinisphaeraceae bacterium]